MSTVLNSDGWPVGHCYKPWFKACINLDGIRGPHAWWWRHPCASDNGHSMCQSTDTARGNSLRIPGSVCFHLSSCSSDLPLHAPAKTTLGLMSPNPIISLQRTCLFSLKRAVFEWKSLHLSALIKSLGYEGCQELGGRVYTNSSVQNYLIQTTYKGIEHRIPM